MKTINFEHWSRSHEWRVQCDGTGKFDEIVVRVGRKAKERGRDGFILHAEMMDNRSCYINVAGLVFWVYVDPAGAAQITECEDQRRDDVEDTHALRAVVLRLNTDARQPASAIVTDEESPAVAVAESHDLKMIKRVIKLECLTGRGLASLKRATLLDCAELVKWLKKPGWPSIKEWLIDMPPALRALLDGKEEK